MNTQETLQTLITKLEDRINRRNGRVTNEEITAYCLAVIARSISR